MKALAVEGVRCFRERQPIPIRPVTLLVGENSSGKSTVLSMVRAAWDVAFGATEPDFNEQPFDLGGFDAIAHYHGGQAKRAHEFVIEGTFDVPLGTRGTRIVERTVRGTFLERAGQPFLSEWIAKEGSLEMQIETADDQQVRVIAKRRGAIVLDERISKLPRGGSLRDDAFLVIRSAMQKQAFGGKYKTADVFRFFELLPGAHRRRVPPRPFAGAPIRSRPERTYDPKRGLPEPEGSHVPMELATLHATSPEEFVALAHQISEYGKAGNLFSKLEVKRLGKKAGDPFQLLVAVDKFAFNVRDVGYGVSQILPILVDTLTAPSGQTFLLQQPEVHLHPRAQAALGSLIVKQAASRNQTFVVETHSDHLLDRVRMEVRGKHGPKSLKPSDVAILYFERSKGQATVHLIELDDDGHLVGVPPGYRSFFLDEERKLLGLED